MLKLFGNKRTTNNKELRCELIRRIRKQLDDLNLEWVSIDYELVDKSIIKVEEGEDIDCVVKCIVNRLCSKID